MNLVCNFITVVMTILMTSKVAKMTETNIDDWKIIESLAEEHPYIVALLNNTRNYTCTGVIIDDRSILTSGACFHPEPVYVAVGSAVAGQRTNNNNIFKIAFSRVHEDYTLVRPRNHNVTRMHSNIALVFTVEPILLYFTESAILGNYFESELRDKKLSMTGYGKLNHIDITVLQHQSYLQVACTNPKWNYCICGIESSIDITYDLSFGEGAPVFYGDKVVGISAFPSGLLRLKDDVRYNVFTVISPYLPWITKTQSKDLQGFRSNARNKYSNISVFIAILLIGIKLIMYQYSALLLLHIFWSDIVRRA